MSMRRILQAYGLYIAAGLSLLVVSGLVSYAIAAALYSGPPPAPFHYSAAIYAAEQGLICPGDVLRWHVETTVTDAPVTVISSRSVWSVTEGRTAVSVQTGQRTEVTWPYNTVISGTATYTTPLTLRPGVYLLMTSTAGRAGTENAIYSVPFAVKPLSECRGT